MTGPVGPRGPEPVARGQGVPAAAAGARSAAHAPSEAERLRGVARDLEGVFVEQLFKAMRETVPEGGMLDGGSGEEMFTGLLDQRLAGEVPSRWEHGLAEALYRQLRGAASVDAGSAASAATSDAPAGASGHSSPRPTGPILDS